jgi:TRAP-type uncharacterized transport system substrate-binding protein
MISAEKRRLVIMAVLGGLAFVLAAMASLRLHQDPKTIKVKISTGHATGVRPGMARRIVQLGATYHLALEPVDASNTLDAVERLNAGSLDFAIIFGGFDYSRFPNLRQVTSLHTEPLHLLVKEELFTEVTGHLGELKGKMINLGGEENSCGALLAEGVLNFAGLRPSKGNQRGDYIVSKLPLPMLALAKRREVLPDAIFVLHPVPSPFVLRMVEKQGYRLVALPFRDAFAASALAPGASEPDPAEAKGIPALLRECVPDAVIPAFAYKADPPVPPQPLHTLGSKILMLANRNVSDEAVERMLDVVYHSRFAKVVQPPLDSHRLEEAPEIPFHAGTRSFLRRDQPVITGQSLNEMGDALSVIGPLLGGFVFVVQWLRHRSRVRHEATFETYLLKVCEIERRVLEQEDVGPRDPLFLLKLEHELGRIKAEAIEKFARGELQGDAVMASFLAHVNDARAFLNRVAASAPDLPSPQSSHQRPPATPQDGIPGNPHIPASNFG